ncbi:hypothetical protein LXA43DRAFT_1101053 [Ganoderma leucocontextum]|nr:hypothetical protein LXA43DRAFT_1101053 [Ganoderma leucocontextum]
MDTSPRATSHTPHEPAPATPSSSATPSSRIIKINTDGLSALRHSPPLCFRDLWQPRAASPKPPYPPSEDPFPSPPADTPPHPDHKELQWEDEFQPRARLHPHDEAFRDSLDAHSDTIYRWELEHPDEVEAFFTAQDEAQDVLAAYVVEDLGHDVPETSEAADTPPHPDHKELQWEDEFQPRARLHPHDEAFRDSLDAHSDTIYRWELEHPDEVEAFFTAQDEAQDVLAAYVVEDLGHDVP